MELLIPKKIHYCWFGNNPLPESADKCIESWKKHCPDYEIIKWDETNYDVNKCQYPREAYEAKKWAFVSDYARLDIIYREGGIYLDTDVELIKPLDDLLSNEAYMGCEVSTDLGTNNKLIMVNPGLGFGAQKNSPVINEILDCYRSISFKDNSNPKTIVDYTTEMLMKRGFKKFDSSQVLPSIKIYSSEYFCPLNNMTGKTNITENTKSIHYYDGTWMNASGKIAIEISRKTQNRNKVIEIFGVVTSIPFRFINRVKTNGFKKTIKHIYSNIQ